VALGILARRPDVTLPPGQYAIAGFPRFGTHLHRPPPAVPADPLIEITGAVSKPFSLPLAELATLPRRELTADFHCVAGWSATNLRWEGVEFETFYRMIIEPSLRPDTSVTHVVFEGIDRYRSIVLIDDARADDVLIAEHLNDRPLDRDHGAPARLVSPNQYGFISTKHLCRIELHTAEPADNYHPSPIIQMGLCAPSTGTSSRRSGASVHAGAGLVSHRRPCERRMSAVYCLENAASSDRDATPSLDSSEETWLSTVRTET
jgi:DMSO/TMAO reductase YedYZ molybdopterin-dependent catalytic subunit